MSAITVGATSRNHDKKMITGTYTTDQNAFMNTFVPVHTPSRDDVQLVGTLTNSVKTSRNHDKKMIIGADNDKTSFLNADVACMELEKETSIAIKDLKNVEIMKPLINISDSCMGVVTYMKDGETFRGTIKCKSVDNTCPVNLDMGVCEIIPFDVQKELQDHFKM